MTATRACDIVEGVIEAESEEEVLEAWQFLIDTGLVWIMHGQFGRTALDLIEAGLVARQPERT